MGGENATATPAQSPARWWQSFMRILLSLIIPTILLLAPTAFQIVYTVMRIKKKTQMSDNTIFLLTLVIGSILPIAATFISMYGLNYHINPGEKKCITGIEFFIFLGVAIAIILTPLIWLTGTLIQYFKTKRQNISPLS